MSSLTNARQQWAEGKRQLDAAGEETARSRHLGILVDAVTAELPKRVGPTFTLAQLADVYEQSDDWVRDVVLAAMPPRSRAGIKDTVLVQDAAFALYQQSASDYRP
jgi:hypothetical protein